MLTGVRKRRVVFTGYGMVTPLGKNTRDTFERATQGESGIDYITAFDTSGLPCRVGGQVREEWLESTFEPGVKRLEKYCFRAGRFMLQATSEAAQQARLGDIRDREKVGVAIGCHGEYASIEELRYLHQFYNRNGVWDLSRLREEGAFPYQAFFARKPDLIPALVARLFQCRGTNLSIVSACSAGAQAIGEAGRIIREGICNVMIAGGCDAYLNFVSFMGFLLIKALAERYQTPQTASRPFDRRRSGFVLSEGAGAVILEEFEHASSRGATVLGELLGYGDSTDAYRITDPHPEGIGAALAMRVALGEAGLSPENVDYINAHGTSTTRNDITETLAIKQVLGQRAKEIPISSNKSMLGHTIAAAGAIECILTLVGMQRDTLLPTINYAFPDPKCDLDYIPNVARKLEHRVALSNSFGFGGQNACLCLGKLDGAVL